MVAYIDLAEEARYSAIKNIQSRYKLLNNLDKVIEWTRTGDTVPVLVNINPTNACNHRCPLCTSKEFLDNTTFPTPELKRIIQELAEIGVKAVGFGGGGDPTCHPDLAELITFAGDRGLECSLNTNGQLLDEKIIEAAVKYCTWIRVSLDADSPVIYRKTHGLGEKEFNQVLSNISALVRQKRKTKSEVTLGLTYLLGLHTIDGALPATELARSLGVDYIRLRPFFQWEQEDAACGTAAENKAEDLVTIKTRKGSRAYTVKETAKELFNRRMKEILHQCEALSTDSFTASFPTDRVLSATEQPARVHRRCYVHHFQTIITAGMQVYPCCMLEGNPKYSYGSLAGGRSFMDLWNSTARKDAYAKIDFSDCPNPCMLEKHNELLWEIKHSELRADTSVADLLIAGQVKIPHSNFL